MHVGRHRQAVTQAHGTAPACCAAGSCRVVAPVRLLQFSPHARGVPSQELALCVLVLQCPPVRLLPSEIDLGHHHIAIRVLVGPGARQAQERQHRPLQRQDVDPRRTRGQVRRLRDAEL